LCTLWNRSLVLLALLAPPAIAPSMPLESGIERGAFSAAGSFRAVATAGALLGRRAPQAHPHGGAMLAASLGLLGLIALRRLRALRAV
jgi:hypothetical protein